MKYREIAIEMADDICGGDFRDGSGPDATEAANAIERAITDAVAEATAREARIYLKEVERRVTEEREACAQLTDAMLAEKVSWYRNVSDAIRARGK